MYVVLFQIVFTLSIIVDVVLWGILFPGALKANEEHPGSFDMYLILNFFRYERIRRNGVTSSEKKQQSNLL